MKKTPNPSSRWHLYILQCSDGTFYTGITNDLERRLEMHNSGKASRYTRSRRPVKIVYHEGCRGRSSALKKEWAMKQLSREEKEQFIATPSRLCRQKPAATKRKAGSRRPR